MKNYILRSDRIDDYFNYNLRDARISAGYTLTQLAEKVGVSMAAISSYERLRAMPSPIITQRIARVLGNKINELFPKKLRKIIQEIRRERRSLSKEQNTLDSGVEEELYINDS